MMPCLRSTDEKAKSEHILFIRVNVQAPKFCENRFVFLDETIKIISA